MKQMLFFVCCLFAVGLSANNPTQQLTGNIDQVTVYLNGASVLQVFNTNLSNGTTEVVLTGLPVNLSNKNAHISVQNATLLSTVFVGFDWKKAAARNSRSNHDSKLVYPPHIKLAKDSIALLEQNIVEKQHEREALVSEKELILNNKTVGGVQGGLSVAELQKAADFFRTRLKDIADRITAVDRQVEILQQTKGQIGDRILPEVQQLRIENNQTYVKLLLSTNTYAKVQIELKYVVVDSQWKPSYMLRTIDLDQSVQLNYQAQLYNNTGFDWNDVQLVLVNGNIQPDASLPVLEAWLLNYDSQNNANDLGNDQMANFRRDNVAPSKQQYAFDHDMNPDIRQTAETEMEEISIDNLNAQFVIPIRYTIPSNGTPYLVDVVQYQLTANFIYLCVPKIDSRVYLIAQIVGWEDLNLIEGQASLYYGDSYVGTANLDLNTLRDTLRLSLGVDSKIQCTKLKIKDKSNKKMLNYLYRESFAYTIAVKNNRTKPIDIEIWDQVPVSQEKDIVVDIEEISNANLDVLSGKLVWKLTIPPAKSESLTTAFTVKYPHNKSVQIRKSRRIKAPRYFAP